MANEDNHVNQTTGEIIKKDTGELQEAQATAFALQEIQGAMLLAKRFPRDYKECSQQLNQACKRKALAEKAEYGFPRGGTLVKGVTVVLARVAAQCWGNMRWGVDILRDDNYSRHIRGWAWDIERNTKSQSDSVFKKLIFRKGKGWMTPDERDLRELTNRHGAICVRNAILEILQRDYVDDGAAQCRKTLTNGIVDPKQSAKEMLWAFGDYNINVEILNEYIGHEQWTKEDIVELQSVLNSIKDGQAKPDEFFNLGTKVASEQNGGGLSTDDMKPGDPATHRGYEKQEPKAEPKPKKDSPQTKADF